MLLRQVLGIRPVDTVVFSVRCTSHDAEVMEGFDTGKEARGMVRVFKAGRQMVVKKKERKAARQTFSASKAEFEL